MLTDLRSWDDDLCIRNTIVRQKYYLEQILGLSIVVDYIRNLVDQLDDIFGSSISRSGFS